MLNINKIYFTTRRDSIKYYPNNKFIIYRIFDVFFGNFKLSPFEVLKTKFTNNSFLEYKKMYD